MCIRDSSNDFSFLLQYTYPLTRFFRFCRSGIKRIGTADPRMAKVVVHGGIAYLSGLTDSSVEDGKRNWVCTLYFVVGIVSAVWSHRTIRVLSTTTTSQLIHSKRPNQRHSQENWRPPATSWDVQIQPVDGQHLGQGHCQGFQRHQRGLGRMVGCGQQTGSCYHGSQHGPPSYFGRDSSHRCDSLESAGKRYIEVQCWSQRKHQQIHRAEWMAVSSEYVAPMQCENNEYS